MTSAGRVAPLDHPRGSFVEGARGPHRGAGLNVGFALRTFFIEALRVKPGMFLHASLVIGSRPLPRAVT